MSTRMSFFWNLAAAQRLGGRKWTLFFFFWDCETLRKMTADRCIALGGHWCCLRTWIGSEGDARQPLVIVSFSEYSWATSRGCAAFWFGHKKNQKTVSFILLFYSCSSAWELASFDKGFHGGRVIGTMWVPMGMVDLPTAPERWCSSAVPFSCFTAARLTHDMTHS